LSCNSQTEKNTESEDKVEITPEKKAYANDRISQEILKRITEKKLNSDKVIIREQKVVKDTLYWRVQTDKKYYLALIPLNEYKNGTYSNLELVPFEKQAHVVHYIKSYQYKLKKKN